MSHDAPEGDAIEGPNQTHGTPEQCPQQAASERRGEQSGGHEQRAGWQSQGCTDQPQQAHRRPESPQHQRRSQQAQYQGRQYADQTGNDPGLAAVLSVVWPGAGHVYLGQTSKGLGLMVLLVISGLLIGVGIGLLTTPALVLYTVYDAYRTAQNSPV